MYRPPIIDTSSFERSRMTVVEGTSGMVPQVLFRLCAGSAASGRNAVFVDGWNSFNPYAVSRMVKSFGGDRTALSRIHVARAFTEYQMDALIGDLEDALADHVLRCHDSDNKLRRLVVRGQAAGDGG